MGYLVYTYIGDTTLLHPPIDKLVQLMWNNIYWTMLSNKILPFSFTLCHPSSFLSSQTPMGNTKSVESECDLFDGNHVCSNRIGLV